jgi:hypothetical protein
MEICKIIELIRVCPTITIINPKELLEIPYEKKETF